MYRLIIESLLGLKLQAGLLSLKPCLSEDWPGYKVHYRFGQTYYHINVRHDAAGSNGDILTLDGLPQADMSVHLKDDHQEHNVEVQISRR
jgi:cellobiose phosphorylase